MCGATYGLMHWYVCVWCRVDEVIPSAAPRCIRITGLPSITASEALGTYYFVLYFSHMSVLYNYNFAGIEHILYELFQEYRIHAAEVGCVGVGYVQVLIYYCTRIRYLHFIVLEFGTFTLDGQP